MSFQTLRRQSRAMFGSLLAALVILSILPSQARADFRGGGIIYNFTAANNECDGWPVGSVDIFRARYRASEIYGDFPSSLTLAFSGGAYQVNLWGPFTPSGAFLGASLRTMFTHFSFVSGGQTGPRVRVVQRLITERINTAQPATIANAREVVLRLRVQNFSAVGCAATIAATLRRN